MPLETGHVDGGIGIGPQVPQGTLGKRVIQQMPRNPMDITMLVSVLPKVIEEWKPTIFPGNFIVPAAPEGGFSLLKIDGTSWWMPSAIERMPPTEVQINSLALAQAIIRDFNSAIFEADSTRGPGLFMVPGEWNDKSIHTYVDRTTKQTFANMLEQARARQKRWFLAVIEQADKEWARTNGSPIAITTDAKIGAMALGLKDKPWMRDIVASNFEACPACGAMINRSFPVCKECNTIIDAARFKELGLGQIVK